MVSGSAGRETEPQRSGPGRAAGIPAWPPRRGGIRTEAHDTITRHRRRETGGPGRRPAWAAGWSFAPDYLPTGETLFQSGAIANSGGYSSATNDTYIDKTLTSDNLQNMYTWQNYLSAELPMQWQPNADYQLTEIVNNLKGVTPQSPTLNITPENWYFVK